MSMEQVIKCFDAFDAEQKEALVKKQAKIAEKSADAKSLTRGYPCNPQKDTAKTKATVLCNHCGFGNNAIRDCGIETGHKRGRFEHKKKRK